jgi:hypothetical protein
MIDRGRYPAGQGKEWRGDWRARLRELLAARGFERLTDFANIQPTATLRTLAHELGPGDVAPIQVQWALVDEARAAGQLEGCVRGLLCRHLRESAEGWPSNRDWDAQEHVRNALIAWEGCLPEEGYAQVLAKMTRAMLNTVDIPAGWQPSGPDDQIIVELFEQFWPR